MNFLDSRTLTPAAAQIPAAKPKKIVKRMLVSLFVLLFLGSLGAAGFFYYQWAMLKKNPNKVAQDDNNALIARAGQLILLPNEQPTIATVTDLAPLKGQSFFDHAVIGDKVLVYNQAKEAYLYDPVQNKIINVAPLNTDQSQTPVSNQPQAQTSGTSTTNQPTVKK